MGGGREGRQREREKGEERIRWREVRGNTGERRRRGGREKDRVYIKKGGRREIGREGEERGEKREVGWGRVNVGLQ